jgi:UPF0716 family protein affecting phage T7 exclusion
MKLRWAFFGWVILEFAASAALIVAIGWIPTVALWLFSAACGLYLLGHRRTQADLVSGILFLAPGFLSSIGGLAVRISWVRSFLINSLGLKGMRRNRGAVDLDPNEWRKD